VRVGLASMAAMADGWSFPPDWLNGEIVVTWVCGVVIVRVHCFGSWALL